MSIVDTIGFVICISFIMTLSLYSGKRVKTNSDYISGSSNIGLIIVTGYLFNTNLGGASTVGATQGAYLGGLYGLWWNVGLCTGGILIGLLFARAIKKSGCVTMQQFLKIHYGNRVALLSAGITSIGVLLSIVTQQLAAIALIMTLFDISIYTAAAISTLLMLGYIILGGTIGAGTVGVIKIFLLLVFSVMGGAIALTGLLTGPQNIQETIAQYNFFDLHYGGLINNIGNLISAIVGLTVSQVIFTACSMARNESIAHKSFFISSVLIIPVSISMIFMGVYMRVMHPGIVPSHALPFFFLQHLPPFLSGTALAALLITVVGTGASVTLGIATVISNDLIGYFRPDRSEKNKLISTRLIIVCVLIVTYILSCLNENAYVPVFTMVSMALRSSINCAPIWALCLFRTQTDPRHCITAMICGVLIYTVIGIVFNTTLYSIVLSLAVSLSIILLTGKRTGKYPDIRC